MKSLKNIFKNLTDLQKRILFTLGALVVYRIGSYIPLPGVDAGVVSGFLNLNTQNSGGLMDLFNSFSGGSLERMSVLALNIFPYISASIVIQLLTATSKSLSDLRKEGESGRVKINQYTRYLAVFLAVVQGWAVTRGLEHISNGGMSAVVNPGAIFQLTATVALVGGTVFIMWLAEQITARGIGQGASLLIFAGIISDLPGGVKTILTKEVAVIAFVCAVVVAMVALIAFMEQAQRRLQILYPRQAMANGVANTNVSYLPLKVNMSGVMGPVFASSIMMLPAFVLRFIGNPANPFVQRLQEYSTPGHWVYIVMYTLLIAFFAYFQTAVVFNSEETSNNLKNMGGYIPGVRPGEQTMQYLDSVVTRTTAIGVVYLVAICVLPLILRENNALPVMIGGTSVLIVAGVILDTYNQVKSYLVEKQYGGIVSKTQRKGRFR